MDHIYLSVAQHCIGIYIYIRKGLSAFNFDNVLIYAKNLFPCPRLLYTYLCKRKTFFRFSFVKLCTCARFSILWRRYICLKKTALLTVPSSLNSVCVITNIMCDDAVPNTSPFFFVLCDSLFSTYRYSYTIWNGTGIHVYDAKRAISKKFKWKWI